MSISHRKPQTPTRLAGLGVHLIRAREVVPGWLLLYTATFTLALLCGVIRATIAYPTLWVALKLIGEPTSPANELSLLIGYGPLALFLITLIEPFGGWWWERRSGGRPPSRRERDLYADAIATLKRQIRSCAFQAAGSSSTSTASTPRCMRTP
jgi:hypothetical protein